MDAGTGISVFILIILMAYLGAIGYKIFSNLDAFKENSQQILKKPEFWNPFGSYDITQFIDTQDVGTSGESECEDPTQIINTEGECEDPPSNTDPLVTEACDSIDESLIAGLSTIEEGGGWAGTFYKDPTSDICIPECAPGYLSYYKSDYTQDSASWMCIQDNPSDVGALLYNFILSTGRGGEINGQSACDADLMRAFLAKHPTEIYDSDTIESTLEWTDVRGSDGFSYWCSAGGCKDDKIPQKIETGDDNITVHKCRLSHVKENCVPGSGETLSSLISVTPSTPPLSDGLKDHIDANQGLYIVQKFQGRSDCSYTCADGTYPHIVDSNGNYVDDRWNNFNNDEVVCLSSAELIGSITEATVYIVNRVFMLKQVITGLRSLLQRGWNMNNGPAHDDNSGAFFGTESFSIQWGGESESFGPFSDVITPMEESATMGQWDVSDMYIRNGRALPVLPSSIDGYEFPTIYSIKDLIDMMKLCMTAHTRFRVSFPSGDPGSVIINNFKKSVNVGDPVGVIHAISGMAKCRQIGLNFIEKRIETYRILLGTINTNISDFNILNQSWVNYINNESDVQHELNYTHWLSFIDMFTEGNGVVPENTLENLFDDPYSSEYLTENNSGSFNALPLGWKYDPETMLAIDLTDTYINDIRSYFRFIVTSSTISVPSSYIKANNPYMEDFTQSRSYPINILNILLFAEQILLNHQYFSHFTSSPYRPITQFGTYNYLPTAFAVYFRKCSERMWNYSMIFGYSKGQYTSEITTDYVTTNDSFIYFNYLKAYRENAPIYRQFVQNYIVYPLSVNKFWKKQTDGSFTAESFSNIISTFPALTCKEINRFLNHVNSGFTYSPDYEYGSRPLRFTQYTPTSWYYRIPPCAGHIMIMDKTSRIGREYTRNIQNGEGSYYYGAEYPTESSHEFFANEEPGFIFPGNHMYAWGGSSFEESKADAYVKRNRTSNAYGMYHASFPQSPGVWWLTHTNPWDDAESTRYTTSGTSYGINSMAMFTSLYRYAKEHNNNRSTYIKNVMNGVYTIHNNFKSISTDTNNNDNNISRFVLGVMPNAEMDSYYKITNCIPVPVDFGASLFDEESIIKIGLDYYFDNHNLSTTSKQGGPTWASRTKFGNIGTCPESDPAGDINGESNTPECHIRRRYEFSKNAYFMFFSRAREEHIKNFGLLPYSYEAYSKFTMISHKNINPSDKIDILASGTLYEDNWRAWGVGDHQYYQNFFCDAAPNIIN